MRLSKLLMPFVLLFFLAPALSQADQTTDDVVAFVTAQANGGKTATEIADLLLDEDATQTLRDSIAELIEQMLVEPANADSLAGVIVSQAAASELSWSAAETVFVAADSQDDRAGNAQAQQPTLARSSRRQFRPPRPPSGHTDPSPFD